MVKLQELSNKKQNKICFSVSVPVDIVKILKLKKGDRFAVSFDPEKKRIEYTKLDK